MKLDVQIDLHLHHDDEASGSVDRKLAQILTQLGAIRAQEKTAMASVQNIKDKVVALQESVARETDLNTSIKSAVVGQTAMLADIKAQLAAAIASGADPDALQGIVDQMDAVIATNTAQADELVAAVLASTSAS